MDPITRQYILNRMADTAARVQPMLDRLDAHFREVGWCDEHATRGVNCEYRHVSDFDPDADF